MSITWKLEPITTSNAMCVQTGKSAYSVHTEEGYFHSAPAAICLCYFSMPWSAIIMMIMVGNESDYDDDDASQNGFCDTWLS